MTWLNRYPRPGIVTFDRGPEFKADFKKVMEKEFNLEVKPTSVRNPQANTILERVHQTIGNMIRTFQVYNRDDLDEEDPWSGILSAVMFAMRSTYHTTLEATPMQLVFGRDAILPIFHQADWQYIKAKKQRLMNMNNQRENANAFHILIRSMIRYYWKESRRPNMEKKNMMALSLFWQFMIMDQHKFKNNITQT